MDLPALQVVNFSRNRCVDIRALWTPATGSVDQWKRKITMTDLQTLLDEREITQTLSGLTRILDKRD